MGQHTVLYCSIPFQMALSFSVKKAAEIKYTRTHFSFENAINYFCERRRVEARVCPSEGGRHRALTGRQRAQLSCVLWIYPDNGQTDYLEQWQNYWDNGAPWFSVGVRIGLWHFFFFLFDFAETAWVSDSAGAKDSGEMISLWTVIWSNIFSFFFSFTGKICCLYLLKEKKLETLQGLSLQCFIHTL